MQDELAVNYCQLAVVSTDPPEVTAAFRAGLGATFTFLSDHERRATPRCFPLDRWTPAATVAPIFFVVPDPQAGLALFAPVHATLLPPGTLGPGGTPIDDFRIMLFGRAGDRVKAASFTPTPLGQSLPGTTCCSSSTRPGCRRSPASCTCNEGAIQTSRGRSPSTMIRHRTRLCLRS